VPGHLLGAATLKRAVNALALAGGNQSAAAKSLSMTRQTFLHHLEQARARGIVADDKPSIDVVATDRRQTIAMQDRIRLLEDEIKAIHRSELSTEMVRESILGIVGKCPTDIPKWLIEDRKGKSFTGVPTTLWSDWHWGEVVRPAEVSGLNEFNMAVAHRRLVTLVDRAVDLCFHHMTNPAYPGIVVALGGDMISGDIHEELVETNELPTMPVLLDLFTQLAGALDILADRFGHVFVPCVAGNHGRATKRPRFKRRAHTNYDWLLYCLLERHFAAKGDKRLRFMVPDGTDAAWSIYGHRYLLTHGDNLGVKGGDGIIGAIGPIMRGDSKIRNAAGIEGKPFDTLMMGHWHQLITMFPRLVVNGSLKGYDEFAKLALRAPPEEPQQALWFTNPSRGITCNWPIKLDAKRAPAKASDWVSWRAA
jgi:hypothetical protein